MNSTRAFLPALRVGSVPYLNARPLWHCLPEPPVLCPPAALAHGLRAGEFDVALVPVVEVLEHPEYSVVDGLAIGARRAVTSVLLVSESPVEDWRTVATDADSRTSNALARVIIERFWKRHVRWVDSARAGTGHPGPADARVMIGDPARDFRRTHPHWVAVDLAEEWQRETGLPFVFAVWAMAPRRASRGLANYMREIGKCGLAQRDVYAANEADRAYLNHHLSYELGREEHKAIKRFAEELEALGLVPAAPEVQYR